MQHEPTFSWILHFPEETGRRRVLWDGNHAASHPQFQERSADLSTRALLILSLGSRNAMEAANCSLRVKRPLLDPRFEGYKLSLEPLPCYQLELDAGGIGGALSHAVPFRLGCHRRDPLSLWLARRGGLSLDASCGAAPRAAVPGERYPRGDPGDPLAPRPSFGTVGPDWHPQPSPEVPRIPGPRCAGGRLSFPKHLFVNVFTRKPRLLGKSPAPFFF